MSQSVWAKLDDLRRLHPEWTLGDAVMNGVLTREEAEYMATYNHMTSTHSNTQSNSFVSAIIGYMFGRG